MNTGHNKAISLSQALSDAEASKISTVTVTGPEVTGEYKGSKETFTTTIPGAAHPGNLCAIPVHDAADAVGRKQGNELW